MSNMVNALMSGDNAISATNLWSQAVSLAPLIGIIFAFAFGFYLLRRVIKGGAKGKLKI